MKREQIKLLRAWTEGAAGAELPFVYSDGVLRLIDERDVLLNAATGAHALLERIEYEGMEARNGLAAAIAKAEEP